MPHFALCSAIVYTHQNGHQCEKSQFLQVHFHKYYWNMIYTQQIEDFKIKFVGKYIQTAGDKSSQ